MNTFFQNPLGQLPIIVGISTVNVLSGAENITYSDTHFNFQLDNSSMGIVNIGIGVRIPSTGQIWPAGFN